MIEIIGENAFKLDGEFIDLIALRTRALLSGDGARIHSVSGALSLVSGYFYLYRSKVIDDKERAQFEDTIRRNYARYKLVMMGP